MGTVAPPAITTSQGGVGRRLSEEAFRDWDLEQVQELD